ncbi:MAG: TlpA family protein disulfide reductase [Bacteroidia bacterium]
MEKIIKNVPNITFFGSVVLIYFGFVSTAIIASCIVALIYSLLKNDSEKTPFKQAYEQFGFFLLFIVLSFFQWGLFPFGPLVFLASWLGFWLSSQSKNIKIISTVVYLAIALLMAFYVPPILSKEQLHEEKNEVVESFSFYDLKNKTSVYSSSLKGKVVVLNYWATWCSSCRRELPYYNKAAMYFADNNNIEFWAVNSGGNTETDEKVLNFINGKNYAFNVALDENSSNILNVGVLPTLAIIDKEGNLRVYHSGFSTAEDLEQYIIDEVNKLL